MGVQNDFIGDRVHVIMEEGGCIVQRRYAILRIVETRKIIAKRLLKFLTPPMQIARRSATDVNGVATMVNREDSVTEMCWMLRSVMLGRRMMEAKPKMPGTCKEEIVTTMGMTMGTWKMPQIETTEMELVYL